ncbi:AimR family lysis-lysogeny pheromone receptor [Bacillus mycoides]|uniref:AimR family lysis-lysogeny pheromone receptor n=1 Tax=Bacillus mycoides TaxID=1405 RepID=UPI003CFEA802
MKGVRKILKKQLDDSAYTQNGLATAIDSYNSVLTDFFLYEKEVSMYAIYKINHTLLSNQKKHIELYCSNIFSHYKKTININMKILFVIAYINGYKKMLNELIVIAKAHPENYVKKYAPLFNLFKKRSENKCNKVILEELEGVRKTISKKEHIGMEILCDILYLLSAGDVGDFGMFDTYIERLKENINKISNKELKSIYTMWMDDILGYLLLRRKNIEEFKQSIQKLKRNKELKFFPVVSAMINVRLGEECFFYDYESSMRYTSKGLRVLREFNCEFKYRIACNNLNFLKLIHNRDIDTICLSELHLAELALYWILKGKPKKAIRILKKLKVKNGKLTAIQTCYLGQATNDLSLLARANEMCIEKGDYFFLQYTDKVYKEFKNKICVGGAL